MEKKGDKRDCKKHKVTSHSADQADKKTTKGRPTCIFHRSIKRRYVENLEKRKVDEALCNGNINIVRINNEE